MRGELVLTEIGALVVLPEVKLWSALQDDREVMCFRD